MKVKVLTKLYPLQISPSIILQRFTEHFRTHSYTLYYRERTCYLMTLLFCTSFKLYYQTMTTVLEKFINCDSLRDKYIPKYIS